MLEIFGKHTPYILSSYSVAGIILMTMVVTSLWKARAARKLLLNAQKTQDVKDLR
jgi:heme exporter protein CcmD